jgi:hypothetical protein
MRPTVLPYRLVIQQIVLPNRFMWRQGSVRMYSGDMRFESRPMHRLLAEVYRGMPSVAVPLLSMSFRVHHPSIILANYTESAVGTSLRHHQLVTQTVAFTFFFTSVTTVCRYWPPALFDVPWFVEWMDFAKSLLALSHFVP